jgi:endonuclease
VKAGYRRWLEAQKYDAGKINAQMYRASRVEEHYGNLDEHYANDRLASLIDSFKYSTDDKRHNRPIRARSLSMGIFATI